MNGLQRYAVSAGAVALATVFRWLVDGWVGPNVPFITFFPVVAIVGVIAGLGPAVVTTICGGLLANFLFIQPRYSLMPDAPQDWVGLALFFVMCALIILLTEQIRRGREGQTRALEETNRQKDEFISVLAHELRNPLAAISNAVELVCRNGGDLSKDARLAVGIIDRQSAQLKHLVDEILDVARINSGRITITSKPVDLAEIASECVDTVRPRCQNAGVGLLASGLNEPIWVLGDRARLIQVLSNLLDNACRHTPAGGRISIALERHRDSCDLKVADTGEGMEPATLDRLFEAFFQAETGKERYDNGLGLGLNLVKRLVEKHGGTVRAHSEGLGRGAEFMIQLPTITAASPEVRELKPVINHTP